jgi:hypothetical protein
MVETSAETTSMKNLLALALIALFAVGGAVSPANDAYAASRKVCGTTSSGTGIVAVGPTSCPFARAVIRKWRTYRTVKLAPGVFGGPDKTFRVFSGAAKRSITMHCRTHVQEDNIFGLCTGGNGARVEERS